VPRKFSRYCPYHYYRLARVRDLEGRVITKGELQGYKALALEFMDRNAEHPAVVAAHAHMAELLAETEEARFLGSEFDRLRQGGATPREMVALVLAMYGWQELNPRPLGDKCFDLNLARAVLRVVPARTSISRRGKKQYHRVRGSHAEALGRHLREHLGLFALTAVRHIAESTAAGFKAKETMRDALGVPFDKGATTTATGDDEKE
jgi:hypothetical protein